MLTEVKNLMQNLHLAYSVQQEKLQSLVLQQNITGKVSHDRCAGLKFKIQILFNVLVLVVS